MFLVVSYDIPDDRRRARIARLMEGYGARVQYSVFECNLTEPQVSEMAGRLRKLIVLREDSIRFYSLCRGDVRRIRCLGGRPLTRDALVYVH